MRKRERNRGTALPASPLNWSARCWTRETRIELDCWTAFMIREPGAPSDPGCAGGLSDSGRARAVGFAPAPVSPDRQSQRFSFAPFRRRLRAGLARRHRSSAAPAFSELQPYGQSVGATGAGQSQSDALAGAGGTWLPRRLCSNNSRAWPAPSVWPQREKCPPPSPTNCAIPIAGIEVTLVNLRRELADASARRARRSGDRRIAPHHPPAQWPVTADQSRAGGAPLRQRASPRSGAGDA